jgi:carbon starvation protein
MPSRLGGLLGTVLMLILPLYFIYASPEGAWIRFWTIFGSSNQLLAALSLLTITVWLYKARKRIAFTLLPMLFVLTITLWSLLKLTFANLSVASGIDTALINGVLAAVLILLAIYLIGKALLTGHRERRLVPST